MAFGLFFVFRALGPLKIPIRPRATRRTDSFGCTPGAFLYIQRPPNKKGVNQIMYHINYHSNIADGVELPGYRYEPVDDEVRV